MRDRILFEGPETVGAVIMEPVQNAGGCFTPPDGYFQRVREICDEFDVLMISDEVICSWGRLGTWFGAQRYDYQPDVITTAKGITGAIAPLGAMIVSDRVAEPFMEGDETFLHGFTFAGHPISTTVALAAIDAYEREGILEHVRANEAPFRAMLESLRDIPIVGDVRGAGYFHAIELVKDRDTKETFDDDEAETLLRGFLSGELFRRGLICRADDRGDPVIQLSPPLIAGPEQFEEIEAVLRPVLEEATRRMHVRRRDAPRGRAESDDARRRARMLTVRRAGAQPRPASAGGRGGPGGARPLGPHLRAGGPDPVDVRRRAAADDRASSSTRRSASARSSTGSPTISSRASASAPASRTEPSPTRSWRPRASATCRSSRCPTTCRSSPSRRRPSAGSSTSSTRSCAARSPRTSGWSGSCSPSAASTRSSPRSRR